LNETCGTKITRRYPASTPIQNRESFRIPIGTLLSTVGAAR
jgi:hypothetical protein